MLNEDILLIRSDYFLRFGDYMTVDLTVLVF